MNSINDCLPSFQPSPTIINHNKAGVVASFGSEIAMLSETSATSIVQTIETKNFLSLGYKSQWGAPAASQMHHNEDRESLRGSATGVSIHSQFPLRTSAVADASGWYESGRLLHVFTKVGQMDIQLITVYGFPSSTPQSKFQTNSLVRAAINMARASNYPFIIAGDLNHHPSTLDACELLAEMGCRTAEDFYNSRFGEMPCTFKQATKNDVAILSPCLFHSLQSVEVDQSRRFAGHNPLLMKFTLQGQAPVRQFWNLPQPWVALPMTSDEVHQHFCCIFSDDTGQSLQHWSQCVESAVHEALCMNHSQLYPKGLSSAHRGRCIDRPLTIKTVPSVIQNGWHGQFQSQVDQPTKLIRFRTQQVRRLQSLLSSLKKSRSPTPAKYQQ